MARYAVVDGQSNIVNVVEWDGVAEWSPPDGMKAIHEDQIDGVIEPGGKLNGKKSERALRPKYEPQGNLNPDGSKKS